ncbi:Armadillo repeat-containing protein 8 [Galdieria sulphuraria]|nr:Armadillo repeat-containing protein 8 [Galdieria sulphuraria]
MKKRIIEEIGMDYIFCLIEKGEDYSFQEQGMNLLRNLTCTFSIECEKETILDFIDEHCYRLVLCIQDSLQSPCMEVVLQALYVVCNFVVGSERHKQAICNSKVPILLLDFLTNPNYLIRIAAIWCIINLIWKETNDINDVANLADCRRARIASFMEMGYEEMLEKLLVDSNVEMKMIMNKCHGVFCYEVSILISCYQKKRVLILLEALISSIAICDLFSLAQLWFQVSFIQ